ncbi:hypothetical protein [uncultured Piscinibacter sp.]|uniref:hypothetical protein n=1 Tax=uncultured Piscinibacter sp. TaxID=1131835 RepID=UPI002638E75D|nr:hypothetical protein [uncultured Piscinibacter sp.]
MSGERSELVLARWVAASSASSPAQPLFMLDRAGAPSAAPHATLVLGKGGLGPARARLRTGSRQVLLADAALGDVSVFSAAIVEFGAARIGAWLPARRMAVSWALDAQSNGDFRCMVPSHPEARWELLSSDRQGTGIEVGGRIEKLVQLGVTTILVSVDIQDDRDLDLCAGLMERFGQRLWFSALDAPDADFAPWVEFGQVRRLVLPDTPAAGGLAERLLARFAAPRATRELAA